MMLTPKYFLEACLLLMESDWIFREANVPVCIKVMLPSYLIIVACKSLSFPPILYLRQEMKQYMRFKQTFFVSYCY